MHRGHAILPSGKPLAPDESETMTDVSLAAIAAQCATQILGAKSFEEKRQAALESANAAIITLHKAKAVVGTKNKCAIATSFYDTLIAGKLAKGTASNYLSVFRQAVASGKPVTEWNPSQSKGKGGKGKGGKGKGKATLSDLVVKAFNHNEGKSFEALCANIQAQWENDTIKTLHEGFVEYLKAEGFEIK